HGRATADNAGGGVQRNAPCPSFAPPGGLIRVAHHVGGRFGPVDRCRRSGIAPKHPDHGAKIFLGEVPCATSACARRGQPQTPPCLDHLGRDPRPHFPPDRSAICRHGGVTTGTLSAVGPATGSVERPNRVVGLVARSVPGRQSRHVTPGAP